MASSASAFAAALTADLHASIRPCAVEEFGDATILCGKPGGPARATCQFGHVESTTICPDCMTYHLTCSVCWRTGLEGVPITIRTEVSA